MRPNQITIQTVMDTHTSAITVDVFIKRAGSTCGRIWAKDFSVAVGSSHVDTASWTVAAGDIIEWDAAVLNKVDGVITGMVVKAQ